MNEILSDLLKIKRTIQPQLEIKVTDWMPTKTVQAKRHARKSSRRWQKKYRKRFGTKEIKSNEIYQIGNMLIMSPETEARVMRHMQEQTGNFFDSQNSNLWNGQPNNFFL